MAAGPGSTCLDPSISAGAPSFSAATASWLQLQLVHAKLDLLASVCRGSHVEHGYLLCSPAETKGRVTGASGATTTVGLVHPQRGVFASLGDSLAVLCR
jgi:hypothetical protein